ncbi:MAG: DEAD/DEAH box helicase, partial [Steroidobacteraceae bacterium]
MHRRPVIDLKPVTVLRGVGEALASRLRMLGVETTQDLLFLLPLRYEDRTRIVPLGGLRPGQRASVEGEVLLTEVAFRGRRQMLCRIADGSGFLTLRFFYFTAQQQQGLARGARVRCFGEARRGPKGLEFVHPEYRRVDPNAPQPPEEHLTPIYPMTEGVTQGRLRLLVKLALEQTGAEDPKEWLPPALLADSRLPALRDALLYVHRPPTDAPADLLMSYRHPAQRRLAFEELLAHQLSLKLLRRRIQSDPGWPLQAAGALKTNFLAALPYSMTAAQQRVLREIEDDLRLPKPMLRLVQGDVGCGKTLVAALAATQAIQMGRQVALMAPTELLADQHAQN